MNVNPIPEKKLLIVPPCPYPGEDVPRPHRRTREFDPHNPPRPRVNPDPRPPLPCFNNIGCMACKPGPLLKKPMMPNLKMRQLADCYACRVSPECHNRRKNYYQRWKTYLDKLPPLPNTDYTVYCCDDYLDLGENHDFFRYDRNLDLRRPPRRDALENFLFLRNLSAVNEEMNRSVSDCPPYECYVKYGDDHADVQVPEDAIGEKIDKSMRLRIEPPLTRWYELATRPEPKNYVAGGTIYKNPLKVFHRDTSFTTSPIDHAYFPSGNISPFKEIRDVKRND